MSQRKGRQEPDLPLFDFPLDGPAKVPAAPSREPQSQAGVQPSLFDLAPEPTIEPKPAAPAAPVPAPIANDSAPEIPIVPPAPVTGGATVAPMRARVIAGLTDFGVHLGMVGAVVGCAAFMGVSVGWHNWPSFALLTAAFSFLYWVVPLAFWGQTPGMAWIGISSRALDDEPLSFAQTALRWLGALLTVALAGLPLALALSGSSLSDRLSQSKTLLV